MKPTPVLNVVEKVRASYAVRGDIKMSHADAELVDLIESYIRNPPEHSVVLTITPKVAEYILKVHNVDNRKPKPKKILEFAKDMGDKLWRLTGDTLKFSSRPLFRDGQNRLLACIRSGKSFRTHVVFGIPDEFFLHMDLGKRRNGADALHILGVTNAPVVAATARWIELIRTDTVKKRHSLTPLQTKDVYESCDGELIKEALVASRRVFQADQTPRSLAGALYYQFAQVNRDLAAQFFEAWITGNTAGRMKPIKKAAEEINSLRHSSKGRVHDVVRAAVWVIAWNLMITKRTGTKPDFAWHPDAPFPKIKSRG